MLVVVLLLPLSWQWMTVSSTTVVAGAVMAAAAAAVVAAPTVDDSNSIQLRQRWGWGI